MYRRMGNRETETYENVYDFPRPCCCTAKQIQCCKTNDDKHVGVAVKPLNFVTVIVSKLGSCN